MNLKIEEKAYNHLLENSTINNSLNIIIKKNGVIYIPSNNFTLFDFMSRLIIKQQLSNKVAEVIWDRLIGTSKNDFFNFISLENKNSILDCGVSNRKFEAIYRLKKEYSLNKLEKIYLNNIDDAKNYIMSLYGFGEWSVTMICLFYLKHEDMWSNNDATLIKALRLLELNKKSIELFSPYKSFLALHLWKAIDTKII